MGTQYRLVLVAVVRIRMVESVLGADGAMGALLSHTEWYEVRREFTWSTLITVPYIPVHTVII